MFNKNIGEQKFYRELVHHLIEKTNNLELIDYSGNYSPLTIAVQTDDLESVKDLLEHGANPYITNKIGYFVPYDDLEEELLLVNHRLTQGFNRIFDYIWFKYDDDQT